MGLDLGGTRSWSAAAAIWPSGRIESWAIAPGQPSLADQEQEDQVHRRQLYGVGEVGRVCPWTKGSMFQASSDCLLEVWKLGIRAAIVCDNYRAPELHQIVSGRVRVID